MNQQFESLLSRRHQGSMKWEAPYIKKRFGIDVHEDTEIFPMFIADMDYRMDSLIHEQLEIVLQSPDFGYFHIQESYFSSIINWQKQVHQMQVERDWIIPSIGTITSLHIACEVFAKGEPILFMTPVYGPFRNCSRLGQEVTIPLKLIHNRYEIDFIALQDKFHNEHIKALLFCNPHNPSGQMWSTQELRQLVLLCKEYHVIILSDEIHSDINLSDKPFVSLLEFHDLYDQIFVSTSPNKTFNISGLTTSYALCANPSMRQSYQQCLDQLHLSCNRFGIIMSEIVYTYGFLWLDALKLQIKENVDYVVSSVASTNISVMVPDCGYLVWIYLPNIADVDTFILDLAQETHVLLESGSRFIDHYEGYLRINVATSFTLLQTAMQRFINFYQCYKTSK